MRRKSRIGVERKEGWIAAKTQGENWAWPHKDMEAAWEAEQTMSLQVSYLTGGNEMGAAVGGLSLLCWAPETPTGSKGAGGLILITVSTLLLLQSCQGVQSYREPGLRNRGQPSGSSQ
jgi:predicted MFS family arabinose efflux permease